MNKFTSRPIQSMLRHIAGSNMVARLDCMLGQHDTRGNPVVNTLDRAILTQLEPQALGPCLRYYASLNF